MHTSLQLLVWANIKIYLVPNTYIPCALFSLSLWDLNQLAVYIIHRNSLSDVESIIFMNLYIIQHCYSKRKVCEVCIILYVRSCKSCIAVLENDVQAPIFSKAINKTLHFFQKWLEQTLSLGQNPRVIKGYLSVWILYYFFI